jgi:hypothetical protein
MARKRTEHAEICRFCGNVFITTRKDKHYCNKKCQRSVHKKEFGAKRCEQCGEFFVKKSANQRFCSHNCKDAFHYSRQTIKHICPICGKVFEGSTVQIYCSVACRKLNGELK